MCVAGRPATAARVAPPCRCRQPCCAERGAVTGVGARAQIRGCRPRVHLPGHIAFLRGRPAVSAAAPRARGVPFLCVLANTCCFLFWGDESHPDHLENSDFRTRDFVLAFAPGSADCVAGLPGTGAGRAVGAQPPAALQLTHAAASCLCALTPEATDQPSAREGSWRVLREPTPHPGRLPRERRRKASGPTGPGA